VDGVDGQIPLPFVGQRQRENGRRGMNKKTAFVKRVRRLSKGASVNAMRVFLAGVR
jgi:hypothetical protein